MAHKSLQPQQTQVTNSNPINISNPSGTTEFLSMLIIWYLSWKLLRVIVLNKGRYIWYLSFFLTGLRLFDTVIYEPTRSDIRQYHRSLYVTDTRFKTLLGTKYRILLLRGKKKHGLENLLTESAEFCQEDKKLISCSFGSLYIHL